MIFCCWHILVLLNCWCIMATQFFYIIIRVYIQDIYRYILYSICTVYLIQYMYSISYTVYVQYILYSICTVYLIQYNYVQYILYSICIVYLIQYMYSIAFTVYVQYILYCCNLVLTVAIDECFVNFDESK